MDKDTEIFYFCDEIRHRLDELKRNIDFLVTSLTSNPQTKYRDKRVAAQLEQIQSECYKLHSLCCDISEEVNGPC